MSLAPREVVESLAGGYRLDRELGQGGMATVYLADDLKHSRQVAIKIVRPELAAAIGQERFRREIEVAARLTHPHILPVHDSGVASGHLYYGGGLGAAGELGELPPRHNLRSPRLDDERLPRPAFELDR